MLQVSYSYEPNNWVNSKLYSLIYPDFKTLSNKILKHLFIALREYNKVILSHLCNSTHFG